jgi:hypothetical protein
MRRILNEYGFGFYQSVVAGVRVRCAGVDFNQCVVAGILMIIGLTGRKYSGKTTGAEVLESLDFNIMSFSGTLKLMARCLLRDLGLTEFQIQAAQQFKETPLPGLEVSWRQLCQSLGTEWGRQHVHPDLWVKVAENLSKRYERVVFDDVRFENEAAMIRRNGGLIIHIKRPLHRATDDHASEAGIGFVEGDELVMNGGDKNALTDAVLDIAERFVLAHGTE